MKTNPWLNVNLADYEGHMAMPEVGQAAMLSDEFQQAIEHSKPSSVALVGCAGGNGLEELVGRDIRRVVCVDVNSAYLHSLSQRYAHRIAGLEIVCAEVESLSVTEPVDLVFGGLVFEYTRLDEALRSLSLIITPGGKLYALTQMKNSGVSTVSPSPYATALSIVGDSFNYINIEEMSNLAKAQGLSKEAQRVRSLPSGKSFTIVEYRKA